jgi:hypothetical protein
MGELITLGDIQDRIFKIRGQSVMLDRDLAALYGMRTIALRQQVRRNMDHFPEDFAFQLTRAEAALLVSQCVIPSGRSLGGYLPIVFSEEGVSMLSSVLRSPVALKVIIAIMRAFVKLRHAALAGRDMARRVEKLEGKVDMHETDIRLLVQDVQKLKKRPLPDGPINPSIL